MTEEFDRLKPLADVLDRDERWQSLGDRSLAQHYSLVSGYSLHDNVPSSVVQHFESAKTAWLYAFFDFKLLQAALMQLHVAGEEALKVRAKAEGLNIKKLALLDLLNAAIERRWLIDRGFEMTTDSDERTAAQLDAFRSIGVAPLIRFVGPPYGQEYTKSLVSAFRGIRNSMAHGGVLMKANLSWEFRMVCDLIAQLFPKQDS